MLLTPRTILISIQRMQISWIVQMPIKFTYLLTYLLVWLSVWSEVQTCIWPSWCHCHSLSLASVKSRLVLPFWYWLTRVVPDKGPLNGCLCVCVLTYYTLVLSTALHCAPSLPLSQQHNAEDSKHRDGTKKDSFWLLQLYFRIFNKNFSHVWSLYLHRNVAICLVPVP